MTYQQDVEDLARHEAEIAAHQSFNYALFDDAETALLGCVYIDPPAKQGADAEISWWVADAQAGTGLERAVDALVPGGSPRPGPLPGRAMSAVTRHGQTGSPCRTLIRPLLQLLSRDSRKQRPHRGTAPALPPIDVCPTRGRSGPLLPVRQSINIRFGRRSARLEPGFHWVGELLINALSPADLYQKALQSSLLEARRTTSFVAPVIFW